MPFKIGNVEIKNRICMAPMLPGGWLDENKNLTRETIAYYEERAKGGAGLIFTGASFPDSGLEITDFTKSPFARPDNFRVQTKKLVDAVHKYDCKLFFQMQLGSGRTAVPFVLKDLPVAPSAVANRYDPNVTCRPLTTEEVYRLIDAVIEGAVLSQQAGADGVNVNGVKGGYLGDQFATLAFNQRNDEFGGDTEGRIRLMIKIVEGIKEKCGDDFPVTTRLGTKAHMKAERVGHLPGEEYEEFGRDMEESLKIGKMLENAGYDAILFGTGTYDSIYWLYPPMYMHDGCYIEEASILKKTLDIPIIVPGKLSNPDLANKAVKEGKIDALSVGRGLVADPYWPNKVKTNQVEEIRPCIYCNNGCLARVLNGLNMLCAVNSDVFCELKTSDKYQKVAEPKKIGIIGGGIAGMEAARVAAIRGHNVTIYEKNDKLGGLMIPAVVPHFKDGDKKLLEWLKSQIDKLGVNIQLNTEISEEDIEKLDADELIVATGSVPRKLKVSGGDKAHVMTAAEALLGEKEIGKKVAVIGGGQVGCETAIWLKSRGHEVCVIENRDDLILGGSEPIPQPNRDMLMELLIFHKIPTYLKTTVKEITDKTVLLTAQVGESVVDADSVVLAIGYTPDNNLYKKVYSSTKKKVWTVGDAKEAATIMMAIRDGSAIGAIV
ncbi:MAG TPA: FAD-dependent oxidoreductase [Anaerovoracaceae bacterium]|nr:FAD-dependent oxidoreductase [Anaerovoracaceae bacterium]